MIKQIAKYLSLIVIVILVDFLIKNIYVSNSFYALERVEYNFDVKDFVRIIVFMAIIMYFIHTQYDKLYTHTKIIFCILIAASCIYLIDRIIRRKITNFIILPLNFRITFTALLFSIGWIAEIISLIINSTIINKKIKKVQKDNIENLK